ncbi:uncharacterized protein LOC123472571 [Daphnia magna]|uniref:uncharacterized protein LOC123472571 n=1 Tax=Daphnia magna TaxID=35525 RepID=UPI001E1BC7CD|nr:uncharacterized protein LOC123472571 [Daphnia magna]XP_045030329.1 uncharacterized protein LOC123472571 [Daphnia magna]XP_045030330.1 uncharacterized protein LOC123472571 [Daphnia magna]XP_045030331.1 uncharacterized protein LOC123472571 [Daphnia magna]
MYPRRTPISHEVSQRINYLNRIRRLGVYHARIKFGEFGPSLTEPVEPEYRPLPHGVTIDAKLGAYEEGFYSIAIKYLPRDEAVAITNIRVNADYARYLNFLRGLPTREPTPREQIHPEIPLPAVLQHPTPREPDYGSTPIARFYGYQGPRSHPRSRGQSTVTEQSTSVATRNVVVRSLLENERRREAEVIEQEVGAEDTEDITEVETNFSIRTNDSETIIQEESEVEETVKGESEESGSTSSEEFILSINEREF